MALPLIFPLISSIISAFMETIEQTNCAGPAPDGQRREVKTFVIRSGHFTNAERKDYEELLPEWGVPYDAGRRLDFREVFGNENPVVVEIGFGMGRATALIAEANPGVNYLGIEVHKPGIGKLLGEIRARGLRNVRIVAHDAIDVLSDMTDDGSVSAFHIFFPDPWPKKRHHKRRLVQRPRTDLLARKLRAGGYVYFVTDWLPYAEFALEELSLTEGLRNRFDSFAPRQEWRPETRFEQKGVDANRVITEIMFERT